MYTTDAAGADAQAVTDVLLHVSHKAKVPLLGSDRLLLILERSTMERRCEVDLSSAGATRQGRSVGRFRRAVGGSVGVGTGRSVGSVGSRNLTIF